MSILFEFFNQSCFVPFNWLSWLFFNNIVTNEEEIQNFLHQNADGFIQEKPIQRGNLKKLSTLFINFISSKGYPGFPGEHSASIFEIYLNEQKLLTDTKDRFEKDFSIDQKLKVILIMLNLLEAKKSGKIRKKKKKKKI